MNSAPLRRAGAVCGDLVGRSGRRRGRASHSRVLPPGVDIDPPHGDARRMRALRAPARQRKAAWRAVVAPPVFACVPPSRRVRRMWNDVTLSPRACFSPAGAVRDRLQGSGRIQGDMRVNFANRVGWRAGLALRVRGAHRSTGRKAAWSACPPAACPLLRRRHAGDGHAQPAADAHSGPGRP